MQMIRRIPRIAGVADIAQEAAAFDDISGGYSGEAVEMGVIVQFTARPQNPDHVAAQSVLPHAPDQTPRGRAHRCTSWRENIDTLVPTATAPGRTPSVPKLMEFDPIDWNGKRRGRVFQEELHSENGMLKQSSCQETEHSQKEQDDDHGPQKSKHVFRRSRAWASGP